MNGLKDVENDVQTVFITFKRNNVDYRPLEEVKGVNLDGTFG